MATSRRTSQRITLLMLVLASVTVLTLDYHGEVSRAIDHIRNGAREVLSPVQRGIAATLHPVGDVFAGAVHYGQLQEENARLRSELGTTDRQVRADAEATAAADQTLALAHVAYLANITGQPAQVISSSTSNFADTVELDKGTADGIGPGMPVVTDRGLVGAVTSASAHTAVVRLVSDPSVTDLAVRVASSTAAWLASGNGQGRSLTLRYVPGTAEPSAHVGALITTSGLGQGAYPAGIPVATVRAVHGGLNETLTATPIVDLNGLEYVSVLDWLAPA